VSIFKGKLIKVSLRYSAAILLLLVFTTSCGSQKDASKENFSAAIKKHISNTPSCHYNWLSLPEVIGFKTEQNMKDNKPDYIASSSQLAKLDYFVKIGFLQSKERDNTKAQNSAYSINTFEFRGYPYEREYTLTEKAGKIAKVRDTSKDKFISGHDRKTPYNLCYANKRELVSIVKFDEPAEQNGMKVAHVIYTYNINELADWFNSPELEIADPDAKTIKSLKGKYPGGSDSEAEATLKLTNEGWEVISVAKDSRNN
jgi:hypothetical protein